MFMFFPFFLAFENEEERMPVVSFFSSIFPERLS